MQASPFTVIHEAEKLRRGTEGSEAKLFQYISMCCLGAIALASVVTALKPLYVEQRHYPRYREFDDRDRGR